MKSPTLGLCFYPTSIALVDDNQEYLDQLNLRLSQLEKIPCHVFNDPKKALHFLTKEYVADPFINHCLINNEEASADHVLVDFDVRSIHSEINNPNRFREISVIVVDYAMAEMNGLDLCRKLRHLPAKIIMLTGEAGKDLAVDAFNEGVIDQFILKNTPDILDILNEKIRELQKDYFSTLTKAALNKIAGFSKNTLTCLEDPTFISHFEKICKANAIAEYYLMDTQGSFLLLTADGTPSWLSVANDELMLTYHQFAEEDEAPASIVDDLKNKKVIPYFHTDDDLTVRPMQWKPYLHPAAILKGKETYYYAHITNPSAYFVDPNHLVSYETFRKKYLTV